MGKIKIANILEMGNRRAKGSKIRDSGLLVGRIWGTFDLAVF